MRPLVLGQPAKHVLLGNPRKDLLSNPLGSPTKALGVGSDEVLSLSLGLALVPSLFPPWSGASTWYVAIIYTSAPASDGAQLEGRDPPWSRSPSRPRPHRLSSSLCNVCLTELGFASQVGQGVPFDSGASLRAESCAYLPHELCPVRSWRRFLLALPLISSLGSTHQTVPWRGAITAMNDLHGARANCQVRF